MSTPPKRAAMSLSRQIKPISYLKSNAAKVLQTIRESRQPLIITQNGEAKAVLQDLESYEETQETLALLKILAIGNREIEEGRSSPIGEALDRIRKGRGTGG